MKIGPLTLFSRKNVIAVWQWKWSITRRWMLTWSRSTKESLYWHSTYKGKGVICGMNSRCLGALVTR